MSLLQLNCQSNTLSGRLGRESCSTNNLTIYLSVLYIDNVYQQALAEKYGDTVQLFKVDVDDNSVCTHYLYINKTRLH